MKPIQFDFSESGIFEEDLSESSGVTEEYRTHLQSIVEKGNVLVPEASLNVPSDVLSLKVIEDMVERYKNPSLKYVVVVGIGGSNLGTLAIYNALFGTQDAFKSKRLPKMLFLDTTSEEKIRSICEIVEEGAEDSRSFVINIISKSGGTTETIANFEALYARLSKTFGNISKRVVVTTDEGSPLWKQAEEQKFSRLSIKKNVGGRYSVFFAVGLFPLGCVGISTADLLEGARMMREKCLLADVEENPAIASALVVYANYTKNIKIHNSFFFAPELASVGEWYQQLVAESLGKKENTDKKVVHEGITPIISVGSTALHSTGQLYFGGPKDKFTSIITVRDVPQEHVVPEGTVFDDLVPNIQGKSMPEIMSAISLGVQTAYKDLSLPFMIVELPDISPFTLGQYMQYCMMEVMYLAKLMRVNAFDQPSVEEYKSATRSILAKGKVT